MSEHHGTDNFSHRAGYHSDPLAVAIKQARKGGTLAAGEGALLVAEIDRLQAAVERVRALHYRHGDRFCAECVGPSLEGVQHPCPTLRALSASPALDGDV